MTWIIPACAGSTESSACPSREPGDHPRMCGEHSRCSAALELATGSSPHVRGAPHFQPDLLTSVGIIPACAGSTIVLTLGLCGLRDHPRMCGEHVLVESDESGVVGSSPHVRGARRPWIPNAPLTGIIPACAGSTSATSSKSRRTRDHPRMCGEHSSAPSAVLSRSGSSPHVRGAPRLTLTGVMA